MVLLTMVRMKNKYWGQKKKILSTLLWTYLKNFWCRYCNLILFSQIEGVWYLWYLFIYIFLVSLYPKVNLKSYCTPFLYCPAQLSWQDFTPLYQPLRYVPICLLSVYEPKWRRLSECVDATLFPVGTAGPNRLKLSSYPMSIYPDKNIGQSNKN